MEKADFNKTADALRRETAVVENRAHEISARFQTLCTQAELLKLDIIQRMITNRAKSLARQAGFESMVGDGKKLGVSLAAAVAGLILGGAITRDRLSALACGMSGFDRALQEWGKSRWAVSLDRDLLVTPRDQVTRGRTWVTMEGLLITIEELRARAQNGKECGSLRSVLERLKLMNSRFGYLLPVSQWVAIPRSGGAND
jgi:hypothetical protein